MIKLVQFSLFPANRLCLDGEEEDRGMPRWNPLSYHAALDWSLPCGIAYHLPQWPVSPYGRRYHRLESQYVSMSGKHKHAAHVLNKRLRLSDAEEDSALKYLSAIIPVL